MRSSLLWFSFSPFTFFRIGLSPISSSCQMGGSPVHLWSRSLKIVILIMKNQFLRDGGRRCTGLYIPRSGTVTRLHRPHHGQITSRKKHPRLASWTKASQKFLSQNQNSTWFVAPIESSSYNPPMFTSDVTQLRPRSFRVGFFLCSSFVDVFSCFCLSFLVRMPLFLFHCMFLLHGGCLLRFFARF